MKKIDNYKKRFFNLLESTMGDVKPLLNEVETSSTTQQTTNPPNNDDEYIPPPVESQKGSNVYKEIKGVEFSVEKNPTTGQVDILIKDMSNPSSNPISASRAKQLLQQKGISPNYFTGRYTDERDAYALIDSAEKASVQIQKNQQNRNNPNAYNNY